MCNMDQPSFPSPPTFSADGPRHLFSAYSSTCQLHCCLGHDWHWWLQGITFFLSRIQLAGSKPSTNMNLNWEPLNMPPSSGKSVITPLISPCKWTFHGVLFTWRANFLTGLQMFVTPEQSWPFCSDTEITKKINKCLLCYSQNVKNTLERWLRCLDCINQKWPLVSEEIKPWGHSGLQTDSTLTVIAVSLWCDNNLDNVMVTGCS